MWQHVYNPEWQMQCKPLGSGSIGKPDRSSTGKGCGTITAFDGSERGTVMSELSAERIRLAQLWEEHMRHGFQT